MDSRSNQTYRPSCKPATCAMTKHGRLSTALSSSRSTGCRVLELATSVITLAACHLLRNLTVRIDKLKELGSVFSLKTIFPSLQNLVVDCSADVSSVMQFAFIDDVSETMKLSGYDYPLRLDGAREFVA